jgi:hypothetical protein
MPDHLPEGHEAATLVAWLRSGARAALPELGEELKRRAEALTPPEPTEHDPHPDITLSEDFEVHVYGDFVAVSNADPYAVKIHEGLHLQHPNGGQAKFLERPALQMSKELAGVMAASIRTAERTGRVRTRLPQGPRGAA